MSVSISFVHELIMNIFSHFSSHLLQIKEYVNKEESINPSAMDVVGICNNCLGFYLVRISSFILLQIDLIINFLVLLVYALSICDI